MSTPIPSLGNKTPEQLKVAELREELRKRGINNKGLKKDLVERLDEAVRAEVEEETKDSSPEDVSEEEAEETGSPKPAVVDDEVLPTQGDDAVAEPKSGLETEPIEALAEEEDLGKDEGSPKSKSQESVIEPEIDTNDVPSKEDAIPPVDEPPKCSAEAVEKSESNGPAVEADDKSKLYEADEKDQNFEAEGKVVCEEVEGEKPDSVKSVETEDKVISENVEEKPEVEATPETDAVPAAELASEVPEAETIVKAGTVPEPETVADNEELPEAAFVPDVGNSADTEMLPVAESVAEMKPASDVESAPAVESAAVADAARDGETSGAAPELELKIHSHTGKPAYGRSVPTSSTDAVIIEASEAEDVPTENAVISEGMTREPFVDRDAEEEEGSVVEETEAEVMETNTTETVTLETVSVVTVVTTETFVASEAEHSTAEQEEGSFTHRSSDAGTLSIEGKEKEEALEEQRRDKDVEGMEVEEDAKVKDSKPMDIDSDNMTGVKRKDGEESRHQEPTKRQRRWNSEKSTGASVDANAPPKVITTDTLRERVSPEFREGAQPVVRSPSTTASSTPKASASFDKLAPSRPALTRIDPSANGEVDKKRQVPPPSARSPTISLKIDRFVRPFTIKAVRELLEQTGTVKDMWMDQIKTHCFVTYSSVDEAIATRNAVYHLQWPPAGGKLLVADFVEPEEVRVRVEGLTDKPSATPVTTPRGSSNSTSTHIPVGLAPPAVSLPNTLPPPPPLPPPPRERPTMTSKKELEPPIPTLDDLFKKTRTKPQIYYLPLTEEQVTTKLRNKPPPQGSKPPVKA